MTKQCGNNVVWRCKVTWVSFSGISKYKPNQQCINEHSVTDVWRRIGRNEFWHTTGQFIDNLTIVDLLKGTYKNPFRESFRNLNTLVIRSDSRCSFSRILRQISVTEPLLCALDLTCIRKNELSRFMKRIFRGALKILLDVPSICQTV